MAPRADNSDRGVLITREAARRINRAVSAIERGDRDMPGYTLRTAWEGGEPVRLCKTTAAWERNTEATLEVWESGDAPDEQPTTSGNSTSTLQAFNKSYDVAACAWVIVAKGPNDLWYLVEASVPDPNPESCDAPNIGGHDLTTVAGYDSSKKQALTHDENACLKWVDIETCE